MRIKAALLLVSLTLAGCTPERHGPDEAAIATNNRGVALMGRFEYGEAAKQFETLLQRYPDWQDVRVNLAIAVLNRQEGDEATALAMVDSVLKTDPANLRAHYVAGLLRLYLSSPADALAHFQRVAEADPEDAYAAYYLGQCLAQLDRHAEALPWYQNAIDHDPYLRSAYYGAFQAQQRLGDRKAARELVTVYQKLTNNPRARLAEFKYTRMGKRGEARALGSEAAENAPQTDGPLFAPRKYLPARPPASHDAIRPASLTAVTLMQGRPPALFIADGGSSATLLEADADGAYVSTARFEPAAGDRINTAAWGDYDNDGLIDLYLARSGANQLWRQTSPGNWQDVTNGTGTADGDADSVNAVWLDADHDGDLDLFVVNRDGPNQLLNNNLDGTFRPIAETQGISGGDRASRTVLAADLDGDRDTDLIVLNEHPHEVYRNDRLWRYQPAAGFDSFRSTPALGQPWRIGTPMVARRSTACTRTAPCSNGLPAKTAR